MANTGTTGECLTGSVKRNRYFYGKLMTVRDFSQEQLYFNSKRWLINRLLLGSGIICGLRLRWGTSDLGQTRVEIEPGLAINPAGQEITVTRNSRIDLAGLGITAPQTGTTKSVFLRLLYHECPDEPTPSVNASPCDEVCESNRINETFTVTWGDVPESQTEQTATACESWLNRQTRASELTEDFDFIVERTTPLWVREGEAFEVAVKLTATSNKLDVSLAETVDPPESLIEPSPASPDIMKQFPTPPVNLKEDEFIAYVYQVRAGSAGSSITINTDSEAKNATDVPPLESVIEVVTAEEAQERESALVLRDCCDGVSSDPNDWWVNIAVIELGFTGDQVSSINRVDTLGPTRLKYSLERAGELLECIRAHMLDEAGAARPGHFFLTSKDFERDKPLPIGEAGHYGSAFTMSRGDHVHQLVLAENSGLDFKEDAQSLFIEGDVGGEAINFLHRVKGVDPTEARDLTTKGYVDQQIHDKIAGLDWQQSVLDKDLTDPAQSNLVSERPASPARYLLFRSELSGDWTGLQNHIVEWNGSGWDSYAPQTGMAVFVEDEQRAYLYTAGAWQAFLASPEVTAGDGLQANTADASLNVVVGPGLLVDPNQVSLVFYEQTPAPITFTGASNSGTDDTVAHGDHSHALPLEESGGLVFVNERLRVAGPISSAVQFRATVEGQSPTASAQLATKGYVDRQIDERVAGLDWQQSVLTRGRAAPPTAPSPGSRYLITAGTPQGDWAAHSQHIATWTGENWRFTVPNGGMAVFVEDESLAYIYANNGWSQFLGAPQPVAAGDGLVSTPTTTGTQLSVGAGEGIGVGADHVFVVFSPDAPKPLGRANPGADKTASRSDHVHPAPDFATGTHTGVAVFSLREPLPTQITSEPIDPRLGSGVIWVQLGLQTFGEGNVDFVNSTNEGGAEKAAGETSSTLGTEAAAESNGPDSIPLRRNLIFLGDVENYYLSDMPPIYLTAQVELGSELEAIPSTFRIIARSLTERPLPAGFSVRWYASVPARDLGAVEMNTSIRTVNREANATDM